jgi:rRNA maturation endonuclease Nob1
MDEALDPDEIKRVKVHPVKCPKCKFTIIVNLIEGVCPVCGSALAK